MPGPTCPAMRRVPAFIGPQQALRSLFQTSLTLDGCLVQQSVGEGDTFRRGLAEVEKQSAIQRSCDVEIATPRTHLAEPQDPPRRQQATPASGRVGECVEVQLGVIETSVCDVQPPELDRRCYAAVVSAAARTPTTGSTRRCPRRARRRIVRHASLGACRIPARAPSSRVGGDAAGERDEPGLDLITERGHAKQHDEHDRRDQRTVFDHVLASVSEPPNCFFVRARPTWRTCAPLHRKRWYQKPSRAQHLLRSN